MENNLNLAIAAHKRITRGTQQLLRQAGKPVLDADIITVHGAVTVLQKFGIPLRRLQVNPYWLLASGHAHPQQMGYVHAQLRQIGPETPDSPSPYPDFFNGELDDDDDDDGEEPATPAGKTPGRVPIRVENWDFGPSPPEYRVAAGDTLWGLAVTYLDSGPRFREIWDLQTEAFHVSHGTPDLLYAGEWIRMPPEAKSKVEAKARKTGQDIKGAFPWTPVLVVGGLVVAGAAAAYVFTRD